MNADGSDPGRRIAYASKADGDWDVYVMNADGTGVVQVTNDPSVDAGPAFLPDGRLLFESNRNGEDKWDVFLATAEGALVGQVTAAGGYEPSVASGAPRSTGDRGNDPEAILLSHVPETLRPTCQRAAPWYSTSLAQLYCASGEVGVTYIQMPDAETLNAEYEAIAGSVARDRGSCGADVQAEGRYEYPDGGGEVAGRLLCFDAATGGRWAVWEDQRLLVLSLAFLESGDREALFDFWKTAGPVR
jgi:hypothetical protein